MCVGPVMYPAAPSGFDPQANFRAANDPIRQRFQDRPRSFDVVVGVGGCGAARLAKRFPRRRKTAVSERHFNYNRGARRPRGWNRHHALAHPPESRRIQVQPPEGRAADTR